jgi:hypothetical protein
VLRQDARNRVPLRISLVSRPAIPLKPALLPGQVHDAVPARINCRLPGYNLLPGLLALAQQFPETLPLVERVRSHRYLVWSLALDFGAGPWSATLYPSRDEEPDFCVTYPAIAS